MYVRLGFAIAININPDIILIDEVLAVGDEAFQKKCMEKFNEFRREKKTIILVSHGLDTIKEICTRAIWIDRGRIRAEGLPIRVVNDYLEEVKRREESKFEIQRRQHQESNNNRWGSGEVEIKNVTFCDGSLKEKTTFETGERVLIRIKYYAHEEIRNPVFGIGFFRDDGLYCYGTNTAIDGHVIDVVHGEGSIWVECISLVLLPGFYFLDVAVFSKDGRYTFDFLHWVYSFKVRSHLMDKGVYLQNHRWYTNIPVQVKEEKKLL